MTNYEISKTEKQIQGLADEAYVKLCADEVRDEIIRKQEPLYIHEPSEDAKEIDRMLHEVQAEYERSMPYCADFGLCAMV